MALNAISVSRYATTRASVHKPIHVTLFRVNRCLVLCQLYPITPQKPSALFIFCYVLTHFLLGRVVLGTIRIGRKMLGVVLWSDARDRKAVIWCEDQGDLAYVNGSEKSLNSTGFFDAGDLVQFEMCVEESTRRACNPRLVMEKAGTSLPAALRKEVVPDDPPVKPVSKRVIPFPNLMLVGEACA